MKSRLISLVLIWAFMLIALPVQAMQKMTMDAVVLNNSQAHLTQPKFGKFLARDPIASNNLYSYCGADPINFSDPSGMNPVLIEQIGAWAVRRWVIGEVTTATVGTTAGTGGSAYFGLGGFLPTWLLPAIGGTTGAGAYFGFRGGGGSPCPTSTLGASLRDFPSQGLRAFGSRDPLVGDLANRIEAHYPGHVQGVNLEYRNAAGNPITEIDILLNNAAIQVKSGPGGGLNSQMLRTENVTDLPVIGYGPKLGKFSYREVQSRGGLVTRDQAELIRVIAP